MDQASSHRDERLAELEARLARVERQVGLPAWRRVEVTPAVPVVAPVVEAVVEGGPAAGSSVVGSAAGSARGEAAHKVAPVRDLELVIGQRWAAWVGAVVFVIGMGLLLMLAWRRGWMGFITPAMRCVLGAMVGFGMLGGAEVVRRRVGALAAVGLNAAGLGVVYVAAYASWAMYELVPAWGAFAMLSGVAVLGVGIAARAGFPAVGVVALVGGYLAPLLIASPNPSPWVMPVHLTALLGLGLGLAWWRGGRFVAVRVTGLAGTLLLGLAWALWTDPTPRGPALWFAGVVWAMVTVETMSTLGRRVEAVPRVGGRLTAEGMGLVGLLGVTGWALAVALVAVWDCGVAVEWVPPAVLAAASAGLAWRRLPRVSGLLGRPQTMGEATACVLAWQCLGLAAASVGLGWSGWLRLTAWMVMGVAASAAARRTGMWGLARYAAALLAACAVRLVAIDSWHAEELAVGTVWGGVALTRWMLVAGVLSGACLASAWLIGVGGEGGGAWRVRLGRVVAASGVVLAFGLWVNARAEVESVLFVWPVVGAAAAVGRRWWPGLGVGVAGFGCLVMAAVVWMAEYVAGGWGHAGAPVLGHPGLWSGGATAAALHLAGRVGSSREVLRAGLGRASWVVGGLTVFAGTTAEVSRTAALYVEDRTAQSATVSVWWAVVAVGLIVTGFAVRRPWPRRVGLGLLGLALAKVVVYDLAEVSLEWRTVSFLALGAVMLGVGVLYGKAARRVASGPSRS